MTDAREIIAKAVAVARGDAPEGRFWADLSDKDRDTAELGLRRVIAAGFRILGPDDVDQVTLERAAEIAANWGSEIPATLRALASGESR